MERVEDAIGGKRVAVVYGAPQLPLPRAGGRWARGRQLRRFARANKASHLLRARDVAAEADTWWAGRSGVSFAAAIDAWAEAASDVENDVVVVPLDTRIYAAELEGGLVEREYLIGENRLAEMLAGWEPRRVRAFAAGRMGSKLERVVRLDPPPFDLRARRYRTTTVALTAAGLVTPGQVAAVAVMAAAAGLPEFYSGVRSYWNEPDAVAETAARERAAALEGSYGAAAVLRGLAEVGWDEAALLMHRDGLSEVRVEGPYEVSFAGRTAAGFPKGAAEYAAAFSAAFEVTGDKWIVRQPVPWGDAQRRSVEGFDSRELAEALHAAARAARAEVTAGRGIPSGPAEERVYTLRIRMSTQRDLAFLAAALTGRPFGVSQARCTFSDYVVSACEVALVAKGMAT